jgi:hypothetical protein
MFNFQPRKGDIQKQYVRYDALQECLETVDVHAQILGASVHMPRIGVGLGGGSWRIIIHLFLLLLLWKNSYLPFFLYRHCGSNHSRHS